MTAFLGCLYFVLDYWGRGQAAVDIYHLLPDWFSSISPWVAPGLFVLAILFFEIQRRRDQDQSEGVSKWKNWKSLAYCGVILILLSASVLIVMTPQVNVVMSGCMTGEQYGDVTPVTSVMFELKVKNSGPPTTLDNWQLSMKLVNGESSTGKIVPPAQVLLGVAGSLRQGAITKSEFIQEKTSYSPIPTGGSIFGDIGFVFPGFRHDVVDFPGTTFTLSYQDVKGKTYTSKYVVPARTDLILTH